MLTVTSSARARLLAKLEARKAADHIALRFTRIENGWELRPDQVRPEDTVFAHKGRSVLVLDEAVTDAMAKLTLDTNGTKRGPRLKLGGTPRVSE